MGKLLVQTSRRKFIGRVGAAGAATVAAGVVGLEPLFGTRRSEAHAASAGPGANQRANDCAKLRRDSAQAGLQATPQNLQHAANGDEDLYPNKIASYSKGLPHNADGTVDISAYAAMLKALNSGRDDDFNAIPLGGDRRLTNPQSGLAFDMQGADSHAMLQPPAPAFFEPRTGSRNL